MNKFSTLAIACLSLQMVSCTYIIGAFDSASEEEEVSDSPEERSPKGLSFSKLTIFTEYVENYNLGGVDVIKDENGYTHIAALLYVKDGASGQRQYQLIYSQNRSGSFVTNVIKGDVNRFYYSSYSSRIRNFVRIGFNDIGEVVISHISRNKELVVRTQTTTGWDEEIIATTVSNFDMTSSPITFSAFKENGGYGHKQPVFIEKDNGIWRELILNKSYGSSTDRAPIKVVHLDEQRLVIYKVYESSGRRNIMKVHQIEDSQQIASRELIAGVSNNLDFNVIVNNGYIQTCAHDILKDYYKLTIDPFNLESEDKKLGFSRLTYSYSCLVTQDSKINTIFASYSSGYRFYYLNSDLLKEKRWDYGYPSSNFIIDENDLYFTSISFGQLIVYEKE